jgi:hypothetical protein
MEMRKVLREVFQYGGYVTIGSVLAVDISFHLWSITGWYLFVYINSVAWTFLSFSSIVITASAVGLAGMWVFNYVKGLFIKS